VEPRALSLRPILACALLVAGSGYACSLLFPLDGYEGPSPTDAMPHVDAAPDAMPDAGVDAGSDVVDFGVHCGQIMAVDFCAPPRVCCSYGPMNNNCVPSAASCAGGSPRACDDNNDCRVEGGSQSCCGAFDGGGPFDAGGPFYTVCEDTCASGEYVVCNDTFPTCPGGSGCTGGTFGRCK